MKIIKALVMSILLIFGASGAAKSQEKETKTDKSQTVVFDVNMNCHNCQAKLEKNIPWEKGVKDMKIDLENKKVTITYDPKKTSEEKLKKAIEGLDFKCEKPEA